MAGRVLGTSACRNNRKMSVSVGRRNVAGVSGSGRRSESWFGRTVLDGFWSEVGGSREFIYGTDATVGGQEAGKF